MVLQNYVILEVGKPATMHFTDHRIEPITITDRRTGEPTLRKRLVFDVDELNGKKVSAQYSTISEKHAMDFEPYLEDKSYRLYNVQILAQGEDFQRTYRTAFLPRG